MATPPTQLTLGVLLNDDATFDNFLISDVNLQIVQSLCDPRTDSKIIYLWGPGSSGVTHLLQAMCHHYEGADRGAIYLPLSQKGEFAPEILSGTNNLSLVCLDDMEELAGNRTWEAALFTAFNAIMESNTKLLLGAHNVPSNLRVNLPDLNSRLQSALIFQLRSLDEIEKRRALQLRASKRGIELSDSVIDFIYQRCDRSMSGLIDVLLKLDHSSLTHKRKLTIPLIKTTMAW